MKSKFSILIVDDNRELASNFMDIMMANDYGTVVAFDGESALEVIKDTKCDLGLIDFKLPDTTGIDLIKSMIKVRPLMEFIIITAHGSLENATEAVSLKNIIAFETKPVDIERLLSLIDQVAKKRALEFSLKESEEKYRDIIDNSLTGLNISIDNKILFCNKKMVEIFGYDSIEEIVDLEITELVHPDDHEMVSEKIKLRRSGEVKEVRYECIGLKKNGSQIQIEVLGSMIKYEGKNALMGTILDISSRKNAEKELNEYKQNLEEKIFQRTEELAKKNEELQNFNKLFIGREKRIKELKDKINELSEKK